MKRKLLNKVDLISIGLCAATILPGLLVYDRLPERIAVNFDISGEPNSYAGRWFAVFGLPIVISLLQTALCVTSNLLNRENELSRAEKVIRFLTPVMAYVIQISTLMYALGRLTSMLAIVGILETVLLLVYGNYAPKMRRNTFFGIRTPHTLANQEVWDKTHRFAGVLYIIAGICCMILTVTEAHMVLLLILLFVTVAIPFLYSEILYRRIRRRETAAGQNLTEKNEM